MAEPVAVEAELMRLVADSLTANVWSMYHLAWGFDCCSVLRLAAVRRLPLLENHATAEILPRGWLTSEIGCLAVPDWTGLGRSDIELGVDSLVGIRFAAVPLGR
jgi:hypothetical protein